MKEPIPFRTAICGKCGREFIPAPQHVFKANGKYYCKWTCYNHRKDNTKEEFAYENNQNRLTEKS